MDKYSPFFLALCVAVLLVPLGIYVKKFSEIAKPLRYSVTFNPKSCYGCKGCPCEFTLGDGQKYTLGKYDKTLCKVDYNKINEGIAQGSENMTVEMNIPDYRDFIDCASWYSAHPSTYGRAF